MHPKPKMLALGLTGGTVILMGGVAIAATQPAPHATHVAAKPAPVAVAPTDIANMAFGQPLTSPSPTAPAAVPSPSPTTAAPAKAAPVQAAVTYVVRPGDTLSTIAAWFKQHGFEKLYEKNKAVIGADPDFIKPGQRITVSAGTMTVQR